ncbi:MAG: hypothetical protein ACKPHU_10410, partial [Planctomycetaceae bacterium]
MNDLGVLPAFAWDGETMAIHEFRGDFHLSEQRQLSVGFGSEQAGGSFRRSETRLSGGVRHEQFWLNFSIALGL